MSATADDKMATSVAPNGVDELFRFYRLKVGRTCFAMLLSAQIIYHGVYIILRRTLSAEAWSSLSVRAPVDVIVSSSACVIYLLLLITCVACSHLYRRTVTLVAVCYWLVAVTSLMTSSGHVTPMAYYVVVTSYAMLPVRRRSFCVVLGVVTGLAHLAVFTVAALLRSANHLVFQLVANVAVLACANVVGLHQRTLIDGRHRRTFTHIRSYIESRVRLENERQQQEQLLMSVLPVHVAVEMKNKMLHRLRINSTVDAQSQQHSSKQKSAYGRFYDMYVKVHENVSILYADIVNFTRMASDCTAPVLVRMLNELVGKFEQLAQASLDFLSLLQPA